MNDAVLLPMTEAEWLNGPMAWSMLEYVRSSASPRKMRLFGCACVRREFDLIPDRGGRAAVEAAERFADGAGGPIELRDLGTAVGVTAGRRQRDADLAGTHALLAAMSIARLGGDAAWEAATEAVKAVRAASWGAAGDRDAADTERGSQADLLRDIFGNPFSPVAMVPRWRTGDTVGLARGIYEDRAYERLPLLGDALMDAGCDDDQVLDHCRSPGPHARGCWVVDLVLGKE